MHKINNSGVSREEATREGCPAAKILGRPPRSWFYVYNVCVIIPSFRLVVGLPLRLLHARQEHTINCRLCCTACSLSMCGFRSVWEGDECIVSSTAPNVILTKSACSRSPFGFPCESQPRLHQFLLFFQYLSTALFASTMIAYSQSIYFTRRLMIRLSKLFY